MCRLAENLKTKLNNVDGHANRSPKPLSKFDHTDVRDELPPSETVCKNRWLAHPLGQLRHSPFRLAVAILLLDAASLSKSSDISKLA
jgi:hypothetical protein